MSAGRTVPHLAGPQLGGDLHLALAGLLLEHRLARQDELALGLVHFDDVAAHAGREHLLRVAHGPKVGQGCRKKRLHALDVHDEPALDRGRHGAAHALLLRVGLHRHLPAELGLRLEVREHDLARLAASAGLDDRHALARRRGGALRRGEVLDELDERHDALVLLADVHQDRVLRDRDDLHPGDLAVRELLSRGGLLGEERFHRLSAALGALARGIRVLPGFGVQVGLRRFHNQLSSV
jgi:hypothetical protein